MPKYKVIRRFFQGKNFEIGEECDFSVSFGQAMGAKFLEEVIVKEEKKEKIDETPQMSYKPEGVDDGVVITKEKTPRKKAEPKKTSRGRKPKAEGE